MQAKWGIVSLLPISSPAIQCRVSLPYPLAYMIKDLSIHFDPVHLPFGPATNPSSDRCINEIILLMCSFLCCL